MKYLYIVYQLLIAAPLILVSTIITAVIISFATLFGDKDKVSFFMSKWWSRSIIYSLLLSVKTEGKENIDKHQPYVFIANHQGYFDIFLIFGYLGHNFKWMMKEYLRKIPFVGTACQLSGQIFLDDTRCGIIKAVEKSRATLERGMSMVIFPEGTRTYDGKMGEFKRGAFMLSNEIGYPIVPMTINGSFKIFNREAFHITHGTLRLTIHKPVPPEVYQKKPTKVFMQEMHDVIASGLDSGA